MAEILYSASVDTRDLANVRDSACDAWLRTIALLEPQRQTQAALTYTAEDNALRAHAPIVSIIERLSGAMAVVSWRDATHCRYGAQVWTIGSARDTGVCALSGQPIDKSDLVFRPQRSRPPALNADAMILATAMDNAGVALAPVLDDAQPTIAYRSNAR
ncbi:DUF3331 domain-containing protein [Cupriavidus pauculus]|uniref:DUF3331 domain-containing protein n=1 Tax=Cupriavidus pauculus TaxID=82633 RepID=A0A2N5CE32_9BURK|nr:DUF3331 domain-containing protein [Cupriavidus pauculus]PLQ00511.1 hypothetical protein CYJ10_08485 [Cupriavidus pauculus]